MLCGARNNDGGKRENGMGIGAFLGAGGRWGSFGAFLPSHKQTSPIVLAGRVAFQRLVPT